jgi:nucleoside-diphosphate-sugar epimerase
MKLFVFGFGYTALRVVEQSAGRFATISGTVRRPDKQDEMRRRGFDAFLIDAPDQAPIEACIRDADVLLMSAPPGRAGDPALSSYRRAIAESRARRVIYLSTIGIYGDHDGAWIDEDTPPAPRIERAKARAAAEAQWLATVGERLSILRLAGLYGPGRNALIRLRNGTARRIVKPGQVFNRIHVDDAARAVVAAIAHPNGGLWNVCDDEPAPPQDVIAFAAQLVGIAAPPDEDFATAEQTPMARSFYATNNRIANTRLKRDLRVILRFPTYRAGLTHLLASGD